jgi:membrane-associated phospholipid phosphatase
MFDHRNTLCTILAWLFSNLVNPYATGGALVGVLIVCKHKLKLLNFLFFVGFSTFVVSSLKSIYRDPRPYMVNQNVTPLEDYAEYGNPSGHTSMGFIIMSYILEEFFYKRKLYI